MTVTKDHIGGLIFLCLSVAYGYYTYQIPLLPGDEFEPFHARTLPLVLAWLGGLLSLAQLLSAQFQSESQQSKSGSLAGYNFALVFRLLVLVSAFALALKWIGFLLATLLFLLAGYWLLGERRPRVLLLASLPFALGIWFLLSQVLDVYLAPGRLFSGLSQMLAGG